MDGKDIQKKTLRTPTVPKINKTHHYNEDNLTH